MQESKDRFMVAGVFVRRTEVSDAASIARLVADADHEIISKRYEHLDIAYLVENASLAISALDEDTNLVGFAVLSNLPNSAHFNSRTWPEQLKSDFYLPTELGVAGYSLSATTAWLTFFVADKE